MERYQVTLSHNFCEIFHQEPSPTSISFDTVSSKFYDTEPFTYLLVEFLEFCHLNQLFEYNIPATAKLDWGIGWM